MGEWVMFNSDKGYVIQRMMYVSTRLFYVLNYKGCVSKQLLFINSSHRNMAEAMSIRGITLKMSPLT